jgi:hypothetical protein
MVPIVPGVGEGAGCTAGVAKGALDCVWSTVWKSVFVFVPGLVVDVLLFGM